MSNAGHGRRSFWVHRGSALQVGLLQIAPHAMCPIPMTAGATVQYAMHPMLMTTEATMQNAMRPMSMGLPQPW